VIGGGPAGIAATHYLSEKGFKIELYELRREVGKKPCGGGVPVEINKLLPVPEESILNSTSSLEIYYNNKFVGRWDAGRKIFLLIDRTKYLEAYIRSSNVIVNTSEPIKVSKEKILKRDGTKIDPRKTIIALGVNWNMNERDMIANTY